MDIDKSLDEIIAAKPGKGRRGGRSGGAGGNRGPRTPAAGGAANGGARARYAGGAVPKSGAQVTHAAGKPVTADAIKIIISNLPQDVTEAAVRDLMQSTVGPVRTVQMSYTSTGKSTGTATIVFKNKGDANKAHTAYHNRMIDNQRPMKVEIAIDPNAVQSLASRVAPVAQQGGRAPGGGRQPAGGRAGGAQRSGGGAGRAPRAPRPAKKTAEELDAEMAAYKTTNAA